MKTTTKTHKNIHNNNNNNNNDENNNDNNNIINNYNNNNNNNNTKINNQWCDVSYSPTSCSKDKGQDFPYQISIFEYLIGSYHF